MNKLLLLLCVLLTTLSMQAQSESYSKDVTMSLGSQPAIVLDMNEIDSKTSEKFWASYVKEYGKLKKNKKAKEFYAEGIKIGLISSSELDMFTKIEDLKGSSRLYVWIDNGGSFLSQENNAKMYKSAKGFIDDFAVYAEKLHVEEILKMEDKNLGKFEKELKGLLGDQKKFEKNIEDAKAKIQKNEKKIEENAIAQEEKTVTIEDQKNMIIKIKERLAKVGKNTTKM